MYFFISYRIKYNQSHVSHWPSSYISFLISLVIPDIWHFSNSTYVVYICIHKHFNNVCLNSPFFIVSMYILLFIHVSLLLNVDKGRYEMFKKNCIYKLIFFYLYLYQLSILIHEELQNGIISNNFIEFLCVEDRTGPSQSLALYFYCFGDKMGSS